MSLGAAKVGLGDPCSQFNVYIANRPNFSHYPSLCNVHPLRLGEIEAISQACGNGWRKVFNLYAKLVFALGNQHLVNLDGAQSWQSYRDHSLLQKASNTCLLFSSPDLNQNKGNPTNMLHIVMGKTYAKSLVLPSSLIWLDKDFAVDTANKLLVCPYFDYRQLSNSKVIGLVELIKRFS